MPNFYEISPTNDTLTLKDGKGSASFGVRYVGDRRVETRVMVEPMEDSQKSWLKVEPPEQVPMEPGQTRTFKVTVDVPPGTAPGRYGLRLDVVSVDNTDEEYDRGPLISFQVETSEPPEKPDSFPWWIVIVVAILLVLLVGGITWWLSGDDKPPADDGDIDQGESINVIDFRKISETGAIDANALPGIWIKSIEAIPKDGYCSGAKPVILPKGRYRSPFRVLSTASPNALNRCNGVEVAFELGSAAASVSLEFFGADRPYELRAYSDRGKLLTVDKANSSPYDYSSPSTVRVSSTTPIKRVEFGHQTALTLITKMEFKSAAYVTE